MKYLTAFSVFACLLCLPLPAQAGFWAFEKKFAGKKNVSYNEITQVIYNHIDRTAKSPKGEVPADFKEVFQAVFEPAAVKIPFRTVTVKGTDRKILEDGVIYFAKGQLVVKHNSTLPNANIPDFATIGNKLYAWTPGEKQGKILKRFTGDTIELVDYLIDPALLMRYTYFDYKRSSKDFTVSNTQNTTTILRKNAPYGFAGIRFNSAPLWLGTNLIASCKTEICPPVTADTEIIQIEIDRPIPISQIPNELLKLPKNVKFIQSDGSIDQYLSYL
jgi:hypothetical protein